MSMITSLADAERVFGALTYNDLEAVKKNGGNRPDYTDGDGFVRWAGEEYWVEEEEEDADIVFKCQACSISIVKNSKGYTPCCIYDEERWWCIDCYDHYQQWRLQKKKIL